MNRLPEVQLISARLAAVAVVYLFAQMRGEDVAVQSRAAVNRTGTPELMTLASFRFVAK
jgi:hypothetical protein